MVSPVNLTAILILAAAAAAVIPSASVLLPAGSSTLETYQAASGGDVGSRVWEGGSDNMFILVQSTVRDSEGRLVTYLESSKFSYLDMPALESFLDHETSGPSADPVIAVDGREYQVIRRVQHQSFDSDGLVASTKLSDRVGDTQQLLARFAHDGYPVAAGDTLESMWTFVRPAVPPS